MLRRLGDVAREHGLAGAVQHGASTLPDELFHRFRAAETAEIHLATGFQNLLYEHPSFPPELHREIEAWVYANALDERKPDQTDEQLFTTRKKPSARSRQLWDLRRGLCPLRTAQKMTFLFTELGVNGPRERAGTPRGRAPPPLQEALKRSPRLSGRATSLTRPREAYPRTARPEGAPAGRASQRSTRGRLARTGAW